MALSSGMAESLHLQQLIKELQTGMGTTTFSYTNNNKKCMTLYTDSTSARSLASKLGVNRRSRHISLRYLWMQDLRQAGEVETRRVATHENLQTSTQSFYLQLLYKSIYLKMGFYHYSTERGKKSARTTSKAKNKNNKDKNYKSNGNDDNKICSRITTTTCTRPSSSTRSKMENYKSKLKKLRQLVGERDAEVRNLAYKDLLPDQILRAQHALQALQDHLTEQHMRQLLGSEPLQAILGVICQKDLLHQKRQHKDNHYCIQMIDSMDPAVALQQPEAAKGEGKEKKEEDTTEEAILQKRAREIMAAVLQRKQQHRQQPRLTTTHRNNQRQQ